MAELMTTSDAANPTDGPTEAGTARPAAAAAAVHRLGPDRQGTGHGLVGQRSLLLPERGQPRRADLAREPARKPGRTRPAERGAARPGRRTGKRRTTGARQLTGICAYLI